jgi:hypothetical protein
MTGDDEPDMSAWTVEELRVELDRYEDGLLAEGKPRNTITSYVYPVNRFLKWLDGPYRRIRTSQPVTERRSFGDIVMMAGEGSPDEARSFHGGSPFHAGTSGYGGLGAYLSGRVEPRFRLTFAEIERIMGRPLPPSARRHRAWWANERSGSHSHARSWLHALPPRRTANVDLNGETADFVIKEDP